MNTIYVTIEDLVAVAEEPAMIVSDNTGYQVQFDFDAAWDAYPLKTAVFVWLRDSLTYSQSVAFSGDTVAVPRLPAVSSLYVGVTAGDLQTTTPAEIKCSRSILSSGGDVPEVPTESEYAQLMELLNRTQGASAYELAVKNGYEGTEELWLESLKGPQGEAGAAGYTPVKGEDYFTDADKEELVAALEIELTACVTAMSVTEAADGTVTMVSTLENGNAETMVITPDESGNPDKLTVGGMEIPIDWVVSA